MFNGGVDLHGGLFDQAEVCSGCGKERELWHTAGCHQAGEIYCCRRCARDLGCLCEEDAENGWGMQPVLVPRIHSRRTAIHKVRRR